MPRLSRTRRNDAPDEPPMTGTILDVFPGYKPEPKPKAQEPTIADLMQKLGAMQQRLDDTERTTAVADSVPRQEPKPQFTAPEPKLNLDDLPDPIADGKGYAAAIAQRTMQYQAEMQQYNQQRTAAMTPKPLGDPDALWEDFAEANPAYAEDEAKAEFATTQAVKRLAKRGVDVKQFMFKHSDQFYKAITGEYDRIFGSPVERDDDNHDMASATDAQRSAPSRRKVRADDDDGDDGRTDGIMGQGDMPGRREGPPKAPGGLIEDLQAIQRKTGYY